jgi:hypothetical protein
MGRCFARHVQGQWRIKFALSSYYSCTYDNQIKALQNSFAAHATNALFPMSKTIQPAINLKRKVGYQDEITSTREKLSRMDLDDTAARSENGDQERLG